LFEKEPEYIAIMAEGVAGSQARCLVESGQHSKHPLECWPVGEFIEFEQPFREPHKGSENGQKLRLYKVSPIYPRTGLGCK